MINALTVTNPLGESIRIELRSPEQSGFLITNIEGLGPSEADINLTDILSLDGSVFNSARLTYRDIVLSLEFLEHPTVEATRLSSYRFFPIKKKVGLMIETDSRIGLITGYVKSNPVDIFSKSESSSITIRCDNPYFYSNQINSVLFSGVNPLFQFPFSNESLVDKLIVFGEIYTNEEQNVYYDGDSEIGITLYMHSIGNVVNPIFYNSRTLESMTINTTKLAALTGFGIIDGDDIIITTTKGNKTITLIRGGLSYNILNTIGINSSWPQLSYGDNLFRYAAFSGEENMQVRIENKTIYEGL